MSTVNGYEVGVTREDTEIMPPGTPPGAGAVHLFIGPAGFPFGGLLSGIKGADGLPAWGSVARDHILRGSNLVSGLWGSVLAKCITKIAVRGYTLDDDTDSQTRLGRSKAILESYGPGWVAGLIRGMPDYLSTNFGQVIAIERAANKPGARIVGLIHLDALRCTPTADPEYPLLYWSPHGGVFLLPAWGVIRLTDMTHPDPLAYGYGQCASDRAWEAVIQDAAITTYFREKITGSRNLSIFIIRGLTFQQLNDALTTSEAGREARNFLIYKGSTLIPLLSDTEVQLTEIPLASVPDGFDVDQARADIRLRFANAAGVPVQDIAPLSGQGLGTGTQTVIQDEAYEGMGLAAYPKLLAEAFNRLIFPESTTFKVYTNDLRDKKQEADVKNAQATAIMTLVGTAQAPGVISQAQGLNLAADWGVVPREFVPAQGDVTPGGTLTSEQKPLSEPEQAAAGMVAEVQQRALAQVQQRALPVTKAYEGIDSWINSGYADQQRQPKITSNATVADIVAGYRLLEEERKRLGIEPVAHQRTITKDDRAFIRAAITDRYPGDWATKRFWEQVVMKAIDDGSVSNDVLTDLIDWARGGVTKEAPSEMMDFDGADVAHMKAAITNVDAVVEAALNDRRAWEWAWRAMEGGE